MKLARANERALMGGRDPLIQRGAIIKSGRSTYRVEHVRGSTVTVAVLIPWHKVIAGAAARLSARIRRRFRPKRPNVGRPQILGMANHAAGDVVEVKK